MATRVRAALGNRLGVVLLGVALAVAAVAGLLPGGPRWLAAACLLLGLAAYGATVAIQLWVPVRAERSKQIDALRTLRACIAEQAAAQEYGEATRGILAEALRRVDQQMIPAVEQLTRRHARLRRDLGRFQSGELPAPDRERLEQLVALRERQERAMEAVERQAANAYASLVMLTQQAEDEARLAADAGQWSNDLAETQRNLAELLDEDAAFERALREGGSGKREG